MQKRNILQVLSTVSLVCLVAVFCLAPAKTASEATTENQPVREVVISVDEVNAPIEQSESAPIVKEYTEEQLKARFASMLNLNRCYGEAFFNKTDIANASALALFDYSTELAGFGLCVNTCLVEGFAKSFYGVELDTEALNSTEAPNGYFAVPVFESGTQLYSVISITQTDEVYEVVCSVTIYYGGDDTVSTYARATFVADTQSEFGFNLTFCEIL